MDDPTHKGHKALWVEQPDDALYSQAVLTQDQCEAIGCVAVESSRLEFVFDLLIWKLLKIEEPDQGNAVTGKMQFKAKLDLFNELLKLQSPSVAAAFKPLFDDITAAIPKRRVVIHGRWELYAKDAKTLADMVAGMFSRKDLNAAASLPKRERIHASEVMAIAREFSNLYERLHKFLSEHSGAFQ